MSILGPDKEDTTLMQLPVVVSSHPRHGAVPYIDSHRFMNFRPDRFATVYCIQPWLRRRRSRTRQIPILMYHSISDDCETGVGHYFTTVTAPKIFAEHMRFLHESSYRSISLQECWRLLARSDSDHTPYVVLTFDDGYGDFYSNAVPVLQRYGFSATMFLSSGYIGAYPKIFNGRECLTWAKVRALARQGITFGSHTVTHPQLATLSHSEVEHEVEHSKQAIEDQIGASVDTFAYPYAFPENNRAFRRRLSELLVKCGYGAGVSTIVGMANHWQDRYFLPRIPVNKWDDPVFFGAKIAGAYDWLHSLQYFKKVLWSINPVRQLVSKVT